MFLVLDYDYLAGYIDLLSTCFGARIYISYVRSSHSTGRLHGQVSNQDLWGCEPFTYCWSIPLSKIIFIVLLRLIGAVGTRNYARSSLSQWALGMTRTYTLRLYIIMSIQKDKHLNRRMTWGRSQRWVIGKAFKQLYSIFCYKNFNNNHATQAGALTCQLATGRDIVKTQ